MSDVPVGYKQTEVGVIPEDWETEKLGDLVEAYSGGTPSTARPDFYGGDIHWITSSDLNRGEIWEVAGRISPLGLRSSAARMVRPNTPLIALYGATAGVAAISRTEAAINQAVLAMIPKRIDGEYLVSWLKLNKDALLNTYVQGGQPNLSSAIVKSFTLPLPPLPEQRAIASALADVDTLLASLEELLTKKRQLKQGAMQELLTGRTRLEGFEGAWAVKQLSDVADVIDPHPSHRAPDEYPNGVPFVGIGDLDESGKLTNTKVRRVHPIILKEHAERYNFADGLIGLGRVASIGKVVKFPKLGEPFAISPTLGVIRGRQAITDFLFYILKSEYISEQFGKIMSGSTRASVGMEVLRKLVIKLPVFPEQQAIASILSDMDAEIDALDERLGKTRALKQGMMQELLTGRTRLI